LELQLYRDKLLPDFNLIESLRLEPNAPVMIAPEIQAVRDASGFLKLTRVRQVAFRSQQRTVELKGNAGKVTFEGGHIKWRLVSQNGEQLPERSMRAEVFDADKIGTKIVLRHWQPGDRFHPIGMKSPVKLQDWFTNQRVPRHRRHELLIATTATGEIFWVQDQRIADPFKLTSSTKRGLHWHWNCS
jgi:tRNA(Ile)-lysidine synthetase-like protein